MDEYLCLTVFSRPGEAAADFSARLSRFWTHMLRGYPDDFEKVYAETTRFEPDGERQTRKYLVREGVVAFLDRELRLAEIDLDAVDRDDVYTKYEAVAPEWMQIEH